MEPRDLVLAIKAKGLKQKKIEERTGIPQSTISRIEREASGDVKLKNYRALVALYDELHQPVTAAS